MKKQLIIRQPGSSVDYMQTWQRMQAHCQNRSPDSSDECWLLQHTPVFTQGLAGKAEHLLDAGNIPVVKSDRGGQITYHGPGQLVAYTLFDLKRLGIGIRQLVNKLEDSIIAVLASYQLSASSKLKAPGVYINDAKIASIGLRVKKHISYHGIAFNIAMDLSPFQRINPCGYQGLKMTQLSEHVADVDLTRVASQLMEAIKSQFGYQQIQYRNDYEQ